VFAAVAGREELIIDTHAILEWNLPPDPMDKLLAALMQRAQEYDQLAAQVRPKDQMAFSVNHCQANIWRAAACVVRDQIRLRNICPGDN
jgi:hypothetical protein